MKTDMISSHISIWVVSLAGGNIDLKGHKQR